MNNATKHAAAIFSAALMSAACNPTPTVRDGPFQRQVVARNYVVGAAVARATILDAFDRSPSAFPEPFRRMTATALTPPRFSPDWLATMVDPGGFLDSYKRMPPADKIYDVLLQEATGDFYWDSEYRAVDRPNRPVRFHCGLIVHLVPHAPAGTEAQIYETVPTVWVGEHWAFAAHGVGIGRYHDIRFVEPTVTDRVRTLDLLDRVLER